MENNNLKKLEFASARRNFEIELFWKRSLFFWGFIASSFVGFIALMEKYPNYAALLTCFGFICSFCWTLTNRGSKRWQENWEDNERKYGNVIIGRLLKETWPVKKGFWFSAAPFSPSKLAIAVSDVTTILWLILFCSELFHIQEHYLRYIFGVIATTIILLIYRGAKSSGSSGNRVAIS